LLDENRVRQAVTLLLAQKPRGYVEILSRLHRLVKLDLEQHARARRKRGRCPPICRRTWPAGSKKFTAPALTFRSARIRRLIGGLRIKVGSDLYDGSVKTRLENWNKVFNGNFMSNFVAGN
jgi:F-type H+-transporting ATPase subunit delta